VAGAELRLLHRVPGALAHRRLHRLALMADDHHRRGSRHLRGEVEHVVDDRPSRRAVEDLDGVGFHPRAEARGEDDDI
jgi:hypothetical protein